MVILLAVLSVLFVILLWGGTFLFHVPVWIGLLFTSLVVILWGLRFGWLAWRARRASGAIERGLGSGAEGAEEGLRPDQRAEIEAMKAEFDKAVHALKSSKLGRGGANALGVLPWYMIIGPPGSGKSTALRASGLRFPYLSKRGGVRGVGGTRNCEWWLTNDAVLLDTAGRYSTQDEDREEWLSFLDMLGKARRGAPVNGLIVAVPITDVGGLSEEGAAELGQKLRERVDEIMTRLQVVLPVYVFFTKCDLLPGFVETFSDLAKGERGEIWGFTLPVLDEQDSREAFDEEFNRLLEALDGRVLRRMGEDRKPLARERIYEFPQQLEALGPSLGSFVEALFAASVYQDRPVFRGAYLTSGTQEGRIIDRVMGSMAKAFGVQPALGQAEAVLEPKSYFLRDVFSRVIFDDQDVAFRSASGMRRDAIVSWSVAGAALVLAALLLLLPLNSFMRNRSRVQLIAATYQELSVRLRNGADLPTALLALAPLRDRLAELVNDSVHGAPMGERLGLYQGEKLLPEVRRVYGGAVKQLVVNPVAEADLRDASGIIRRFGAGEAPGSGDYSRLHSLLRLHLLLSGPRDPREPPVADEKPWITAQLEQGARARGSANPALTEHLKLFVTLLAGDGSLAIVRDAPFVDSARRLLSRLPLAELAVDKLVAELDPQEYDLTLAAILQGQVPCLRATGRVRGAYTRRGHEAIADKLAHPERLVEPWVVMSSAPDGDRRTREDLDRAESVYYERYISEWSTFLDSIAVDVVGADLLSVLQDLTRGEPPPYARLFRAVAENTRADTKSAVAGKVTGKVEGAVQGIVSKFAGTTAKDAAAEAMSRREHRVGARDLEARFAPLVAFGAPREPPRTEGSTPPPPRNLPIDVYQEQLVFLRDALQTQRDGGDPAALAARSQQASTRVKALVDSVEGWRPLLARLLWSPIQASMTEGAAGAAGGAAQKWCPIPTAFQRTMAQRYPFARSGDDAAIADLAEFFRPSGILWSYYNEALKGQVERTTDGFRFAAQGGAPVALRPDLLPFLKKADDITRSLFPSGASEPTVAFSVRIRPAPGVAATSLEIDGRRVEYRNGPEEWYQFTWPGKAPGAVLRARATDGREETIQRDGEWGFFRLLEAGKIRGDPGVRDFAIAWSMPGLGATVILDFRTARTESPFFGSRRPGGGARLLEPFRSGFAVPAAVAARGPACR